MDKRIIFRKAEREDVPLIANMISSLYKIKRPEEYYFWHCFDSPNPTVVMCGFCKNELIGTFGIQKRVLTNKLICGQGNHLNISLNWQGKGYFSKLGELAINYFKDLDFVCAIINEKAQYPCEHSLGMKRVGVIEVMIFDLSKEIINPDIGFTYSDINNETVFMGRAGRINGSCVFSCSDAYRKWRFARNPMYRYSLVRMDTGEFAVVKRFSDVLSGTIFGDIVDFDCPLDDKDKLRNLFTCACLYLKNSGVNKATTWAISGPVLKNVLYEIGFQETNQQSYFELKMLKPCGDSIYDLSKWDLRQADATNY